MARIKIAKGFSGSDTFKNLSSLISKSEDWLRVPKVVDLAEIDNVHRSLEELEKELAKAKRDLSHEKMERDILKKAIAYFARDLRHDNW